MTYRVRIDDSDFQAKLTMMRASMDATMAGVGAAGMPMMGSAAQFGYRQAFGGPGFGAPGSDIGYSMAPVSYSPATTAMTPNMGQVALRQSTWSAANAAIFGSPGIYTPPPSGIMLHDYMAISNRQLGDAVGRGMSTAAMATTAAGGGIIGGGIGAALGTAFGGPVGGFLGGMVGSYIGASAMDPFSSSLGDRYRIEDYLANTSFRYFQGPGADSVTGRGFGRGQRNEIANFMVKQDRGDFRVNMGDIENILRFGTESGMFEGTQDLEDFKNKFTALKDKVKRITAVLNTTASEGVQVIKQLRDIGITDSSAVFGAVHGADMFGMASGRTGMEMMAIGMQGAEIFRGTGVDMSIGFRSSQMNLAQVRGALNAGLITHERIAQAGGEEALAQQMTASSLSFAQTGLGRTMMMAGYTGTGIDTGRMGGSIFDVAGRAAANMRSPADIIRLQARQEEYMTDMANQAGGMGLKYMQLQGAMTMANFYQESTGVDADTAFIMGAKKIGITSMSQIDMLNAMRKNPEAMARTMEESAARAMTKATMEDFRDKSALMHLGEAVSDKLASSIVDPIVNPISRMGSRAGEWWDTTSTRFVAKNILGMDYMEGATGFDTTFLKQAEDSRRQRGEMGSGGSIANIDRRRMARKWGGIAGAAIDSLRPSTALDKTVDEMIAAESGGTAGAHGGRRVRLDVSGYEGEIFNDAAAAQSAAEKLKEQGKDVNIIERYASNGSNRFVVTTAQQINEADLARDKIHVDQKNLESAEKELPKVYSKIADFRPDWAKETSLSGLESKITSKFSDMYGHAYDEKNPDHRAKLAAVARQLGSPAANQLLERMTGGRADFWGGSIASLHEKTSDLSGRVQKSLSEFGINYDPSKESDRKLLGSIYAAMEQSGDARKAATESIRTELRRQNMSDDKIDEVIGKITADREQLSGGKSWLFGTSEQEKRDKLSENMKDLLEAQTVERARAREEILKDRPELAGNERALGTAVDAMLGSRGGIKPGGTGEGTLRDATKAIGDLVIQHDIILDMIRKNAAMVPRGGAR